MTQVCIARQFADLLSDIWKNNVPDMSRCAFDHVDTYGKNSRYSLGGDLILVRFDDQSEIILDVRGCAYAFEDPDNGKEYDWDWDWTSLTSV